MKHARISDWVRTRRYDEPSKDLVRSSLRQSCPDCIIATHGYSFREGQEWITELSRDGNWIVISGDRRISRNRAEYQAFRNSRLVGFFLSKGLYKSKVTKQMERILALWDAKKQLLQPCRVALCLSCRSRVDAFNN
jgi:hypothetical protein